MSMSQTMLYYLLILLVIIKCETLRTHVHPIISPSFASLYLFMDFKISSWAMSNSYLLPLAL